MAVIRNLFVLTALVAIGAVLYPKLFPTVTEVPKLPELWFGKGQRVRDSEAITKFSINVSNDVLQDLKRRLESVRFVEPIAGTKFNYGFNADYLKKVVDYWKTKFDWRKQELVLNKYNHFKTQIDGLNVHFIHVKPTKPAKTVLPIIIVHGWPGSVLEHYKSIPLLTEPVDDVAFEVIVPSIPGYGFSDPPQQEGFDVTQTARIFVKLMARLGHKRFIASGGDWGSAICKSMAIFFPENVRGLHLTMNMAPTKGMVPLKMIIGGYFPSLIFDNPEVEYPRLYPQLDTLKFLIRESGYMHIQATKPDTVGAALIDSPVGLAAYILEKFSTWTDPNNVNKENGGLTEKFTLDELLTNVMIYWTSNNLASSLRYYKESFLKLFLEYDFDKFVVKASVPTAIADFPHEMAHSSATLAKHQYENLVLHDYMPRGGHFAAFEEPKLVCDQIRRFVTKVLDIERNEKNKINANK